MELLSSNIDLKNLITVEQAWYYRIIPSAFCGKELELFIVKENISESIKTELEIILGKNIKLKEIELMEIEKQLLIHYPKSENKKDNLMNVSLKLDIHKDSFLETIVKEAKGLNSSDIHIETYSEKCRIRFRVDGVLIDRHKLNKAEYPTLINKIKIAAACDIAEKRMPQDGRIRFQINNNKLDIRVSILPTLYGEKIVLRLLGSDASHINIEKLGFQNDELVRYNLAVRKPHGIILISGPTGSGKTTTLYATLKLLNKITSNILTIEDPIEYTLDGVNQVQLKEDIGLTYSEALRTFLRQDPDIIMLGEIRDAQTAQMAIRAALTGHLVLSTIHTNSAWGTISRLIDMGVPSYLLSNTINLSVAQRLIRTLCPQCKLQLPLNIADLPEVYKKANIKNHFTPKGCDQCYYTGFKGRKAIYEVINITKEVAEEIKHNRSNIDEHCKQKKINKLSDNAMNLFLSGETSLEEIYPLLINEF
jgi:type IV pilus assembly protein PilB